MPQEKSTNPFSGNDRIFLGTLMVLAFFVGANGILRLAYIGQDFDGPEGHNHLIRTFPGSYVYGQLTNPPGLYWLGNLIFRHLTTTYHLEILASFLLLLNLAGLWLMFSVLWRAITSWQLRYAVAALITFVPFRTIHAIVVAGDTFTLPFFAVAAVLTLRLLQNPRSFAAWTGLSLTLGAALVFKYTFVGILPPIAGMLALRLWREMRGAELVRWLGFAALVVALPAGVFLFQMRMSELTGIGPSGHWKPPENEPVMRWRDMLMLQESDRGIFTAPQYFQDELYGFRKFSYMGLVHLSSFTDCQNYFQTPPRHISASWLQRAQVGFRRDRSPRSNLLQKWSVAWCLPYSLLAIAAALGFAALAFHALFFPHRALIPPATLVLVLLAWGVYSPIYFNLPRVGDPYTAGYWLPRLVLPALLTFFALGFSVVDFLVQRLHRFPSLANGATWVCLAHTAVACAVFIGFLT